MTKHLEYLNALKKAYEMMNTTDFGSAKIGCEALKKLQELVDQTKTPTLKEVKKEWEALGYKFTSYTAKDDTMREFEISKYGEKIILWYDHSYSKVGNTDHCFTIKEHQLLTKTFKALGWNNE